MVILLYNFTLITLMPHALVGIGRDCVACMEEKKIHTGFWWQNQKRREETTLKTSL